MKFSEGHLLKLALTNKCFIFCLLALLGGLAQLSCGGGGPTREVLIFMKDWDLWQIEPNGRGVQRWTEGGVASFSVSRNGRVAYDRFLPYRPELRDLNIYFSEGSGENPQKLTEDNQSVRPVISPDGTKILYQKLKWNGDELPEGEGKGVWLYDVEKKENREVARMIDLYPDIIERRNRQFAPSQPGRMDARKWVRENMILWSTDGRKFLFQRVFAYGGGVTFWVDLDKGNPPQAKILDADLYPLAFGKEEAFFLDFTNHGLVAIHPKSGIRRRIAEGIQVGDARISPDGSRLACLRVEGKDLTLWSASESGEDWRKVAGADLGLSGDSIVFEWSLDSSKLVTNAPLENGYATWIINAETGERRPLPDALGSPVFTKISKSGD